MTVIISHNAEMETHMQESILQTRCTVLEFIALAMDIVMRELGMKEIGKDLVCTLLGTERHNLVIGKMGFLMFPVLKIAIQGLLMLSAMLRFSLQSR